MHDVQIISCVLKGSRFEVCERTACEHAERYHVTARFARLDLSKPYDRSLLRMLYKTCDRLGLSPDAAFTDVEARPAYRLRLAIAMSKHPQKHWDGLWHVPVSGILDVTFTLERMREGLLNDVHDHDKGLFLDRFFSMV
eukprot:5289250-Amphidinium_carterae.2